MLKDFIFTKSENSFIVLYTPPKAVPKNGAWCVALGLEPLTSYEHIENNTGNTLFQRS